MKGHPAKTYEQIVALVRWQIDIQLTVGREHARLAGVGKSILDGHVPATRMVGDPCPVCHGQVFPCQIIVDYSWTV